jgi:hypothetical protein
MSAIWWPGVFISVGAVVFIVWYTEGFTWV